MIKTIEKELCVYLDANMLAWNIPKPAQFFYGQVRDAGLNGRRRILRIQTPTIEWDVAVTPMPYLFLVNVPHVCTSFLSDMKYAPAMLRLDPRIKHDKKSGKAYKRLYIVLFQARRKCLYFSVRVPFSIYQKPWPRVQGLGLKVL